MKRIGAWLLVVALLMASVGNVTVSAASADVTLARKSVSLTIQQSKSGKKYGAVKVKIKKSKGVKVKKIINYNSY